MCNPGSPCSCSAPRLRSCLAATSSPWHRLPLSLSLSLLGATFQGVAAFLGVPRVPRHCFPVEEVWLVALPSRLRPSLTLCQGRTRGYGTGPPLEVVFCHVKPQHLPGSRPPSSLAPSVHPPWCGSIHPVWPCCYCRCRDRRGCSGRPNPFVHDHCDSPGRQQEKFTLSGFWRCGHRGWPSLCAGASFPLPTLTLRLRHVPPALLPALLRPGHVTVSRPGTLPRPHPGVRRTGRKSCGGAWAGGGTALPTPPDSDSPGPSPRSFPRPPLPPWDNNYGSN